MDWEGFLRRVFQRLPKDVKSTLPDIGTVLDRALKEARLVAIQASFHTQLLKSGVICVASYLPTSWPDGTRLKLAIALLDEAGCRAVQGRYRRFEETDWCLKADLPTQGIDPHDPANRYRESQDLHPRILDYINLLENKRYLIDGEECSASAHVTRGDYRAYTTFTTRSGNINFQNLPGEKRSEVFALAQRNESGISIPAPLEDIDIRASQLKIALALRGNFYPIEADVWTKLATAIQHPAKHASSESEWRNLVKRIALTIVLEQRSISIPNTWKSITGKCARKGLTEGLKDSIRSGLLNNFPELNQPLSLKLATPDGLPIHGPRMKRDKKLSVRGQIRLTNGELKKISSTYYEKQYKKQPDAWNVLVAHEAWLIREAIFSIPTNAPALPVHDQIYFLAGQKGAITSKLNALLKALAEISAT